MGFPGENHYLVRAFEICTIGGISLFLLHSRLPSTEIVKTRSMTTLAALFNRTSCHMQILQYIESAELKALCGLRRRPSSFVAHFFSTEQAFCGVPIPEEKQREIFTRKSKPVFRYALSNSKSLLNHTLVLVYNIYERSTVRDQATTSFSTHFWALPVTSL